MEFHQDPTGFDHSLLSFLAVERKERGRGGPHIFKEDRSPTHM